MLAAASQPPLAGNSCNNRARWGLAGRCAVNQLKGKTTDTIMFAAARSKGADVVRIELLVQKIY